MFAVANSGRNELASINRACKLDWMDSCLDVRYDCLDWIQTIAIEEGEVVLHFLAWQV